MVDKSNEYGYIGASPTQSSSANTGIFEVNDVTDLLNSNQYKLQIFDVEWLVAAGGGGSGTGNDAPGGGGAGGFRNSFGAENTGGGLSGEAVLADVAPDGSTTYTVTVGAGGSTNAKGSNSVFNTITSEGGGRGGSSNNQSGGNGGAGGSGGGGGHASGSGGAGTSGQGFNGAAGNSSDASNHQGGGGGGAGEAGETNASRADGVTSSITGSAVEYSKGGKRGSSFDVTAGDVAVANTGNGGNAGGGGATSRAGASGVVILRYPAGNTITVGAGLTSSTITDGSDKVTTFTAGTDTITFS